MSGTYTAVVPAKLAPPTNRQVLEFARLSRNPPRNY
jgi:hypothetical protein